jgi:enoyl-CoA hydratase
MSDAVVRYEVDGGVATVTLNRPGVRNAISTELLTELGTVMATADRDDDVGAVILTGADPAFCAGLDLRELGERGSGLPDAIAAATWTHTPWPPMGKPVIAAVNGPAVTGGLELALNCDILICSQRARFADTHARVGVMPGWGLTVLLPLAVGRSTARLMSLTGDFLTAEQALTAGLVSEMVPHDQLPRRARAIAATLAGNSRPAVRSLLESYRQVEAEIIGGGLDVEARTMRAWNDTDTSG